MSENFFVDHNSDLTAHPAVGGVVHPNSSPYKPAIHANPGHSSLPGEGREGVVGGSSHPAPGGGYMPYRTDQQGVEVGTPTTPPNQASIDNQVRREHGFQASLGNIPDSSMTSHEIAIRDSDAATNAGNYANQKLKP